MAVDSETEMYPPLKKFFANRGYEVKAEVRGCDLVAVRPGEPEPTIVEMKKTFTLPLLLQGVDRQRTGASVWLAVERNRTKKGAHNQRYPDLTALCRRLGLGLITVTFYKTKEPVVDVWCEPAAEVAAPASVVGRMPAESPAGYGPEPASAGRRPRKAAARLLREFEARSGDYNVGGSTRRKLVTAYRERAIQCALALCCHGPSSPKQIRELTGSPYVGPMLRDNHYGWFERTGKGIYRVTVQGAAALREFREVTDLWASRFPWSAGWEAAAASVAAVEEGS